VEDEARWLVEDTARLRWCVALRELCADFAVADLCFAVLEDFDLEWEGECARWVVDLAMVACAGVREEFTRAAPADIANSTASEKAMNAVRTIGGTRRNQSMLSVRRGGAHLEYRRWFRFV
jgi:hypothetical protein